MTERGARGVVNRCSVAILKHTQVGEASVLAFSAEVDSLFMVIKVETTQEITFTQCCVGHKSCSTIRMTGGIGNVNCESI